MRNIRVSFGIKLFLTMAGIVLAVSISIYGFVAKVFEEKMQETTRYQLEEQMEQTISSSDFYLDQIRSIYLNIAADHLLIQTFADGYNSGLNARLQYPVRKLDTLSAVYNWVYTIYLYDLQSGLFFDSKSLSKAELLDDAWLQNAMEDNGMYHFLILDQDQNQFDSIFLRFLSVGGPIRRNFSGEPVAYFSIQVDLDTFQKQIFPPSFSQGTLYAMYDEKGNHLFGDLQDWKPDPGIPSNSQVTWQNKKYIQFSQTSTEYGWSFVILTPTSEIYTGIDKIRTMAIPMMVIALACALLLSWLLSWLFTKPIASLTQAVKQYHSDNDAVDTIPDLKLHNEFKVLNDGLIDMTGRIDHLIIDIFQARLQKKDMELKMLYQSMDPHFIYNVLDSINWQVTLGKSKEASQALIAFSRYLRGTMFDHHPWTTLEKSRDEIEAYNRLQGIFYAEEIHCQVDFPQELLTLCIPSMILQPVIENCYTHGYPEGYRGNLFIEITAYQDQEALVIRIGDNGVGIPQDYVEELQNMLEEDQNVTIRDKDSHFFALRNIQSRIRIQCGREWGLTVESKGPGTTVTLRLPIKKTQGGDVDLCGD